MFISNNHRSRISFSYYTKQLYFTNCFSACQKGDEAQVKLLIAHNKWLLKYKDLQGQTLLFAAVLGNQFEILHWLHTQEPSLINSCRCDGSTLLHIAVEKGHRNIAQWIIEVCPEQVLQTNQDQLTPILQLFSLQDIPLIHQVAEKECPRTLAYLLEQGISPQVTATSNQYTPLHLAAQAGHLQNVRCLLQHGAEINATDCSKRTPLFLAIVQGHIPIVDDLIQKGADLTLHSIEGETLLHAASFYSHLSILKTLVSHSCCKARIDAKDQDGKTPLHKAVWGTSKSGIVQTLLESGANPNAQNHYGYTPLHWAAKHGHLASVRLLINRGAHCDIANQNHDFPFDLAMRWEQNQIIHFFLGFYPPEPLASPSGDIEGHYSKQLLQSKREEYPQSQIYDLIKLSELYIQKQNWPQAAKLLNAALAILEKDCDNLPFQKYLSARLEQLELLFLKNQEIKVSHQRKERTSIHRAQLYKIRADHLKRFKDSEPIQDILPSLTHSYKTLLETLILEAQELLGPSPTEWACIGMGSMARDEMCPYSDLEFAFLIQQKTSDTLQYFRTLAQLVELKIINIGETRFPIFAQLFGQENHKASPTPRGFSLDTGGNTPLGKAGFYELIDTPEGLAQFQCIEWMDADIVISNALSSICFIAGSQNLVAQYNCAKEAALNTTDGFCRLTGTCFRKKLALKLLKGNIQEFKPDLSKEKQETNAFGIKKELYRPFQSILGSLALFYGIKCNSSFVMIQQLMERAIFTPEGAKNIIRALTQVLSLRFVAHSFYKNEEEFLLHLDESKEKDSGYLYLTEERLSSLHEIYKVLIPFYHCAERFTQNQDQTFKVAFYDDSQIVQGQAFEKMLQYAKAQEAYQNATSLNPNDITAQLRLGYIEIIMGQSRAALPRNLKALALAQQNFGENNFFAFTSYNNLGGSYANLGEHGKALEAHQMALTIGLQIFGENHSAVATSYSNIGVIYHQLEKYKESLENYQKALSIRLQVFGKNHHGIAISYNNIGGIYENLGEYEKGLKYYQQALAIELQILGENHPSIATTYGNIGIIHFYLEEYEKALEFYQKSLDIALPILGDKHLDVAGIYSRMGVAYDNLKEYEKSLDFHQKSLTICLQISEKHPLVAQNYNNIGSVYYALEKYEMALKSFSKALIIILPVLGKNHSTIETGLSNLISSIKKVPLSMIKNLGEVVTLCIQILGTEHLLVQELMQLLQ